MKITRKPDGSFLLEVTEDELVTINNCINDATDLMGEGEFHARVGVERREAWLIVDEIGKMLRPGRNPA